MQKKPVKQNGQIIKVGDKKYLIRISLGKDANGKRRYFNKTIHATAKEAEDYKNRKLRERDLGTTAGPNVALLGDWITHWLGSVISASVRPVTLDQYNYLARAYVLPLLGDVRLCDLKRGVIQEWVQGLIGRALSPSTIRLAASVLHNSLEELVTRGELPANPAKGIALPKIEKAEVTSLTVDESRTLLAGIRNTPYEALWALLLLTGVRPAEALALRWRDVDGGVLKISRSLSWTSDGPQIAPPKTSAGRRTIPLPDYVVQVLAERKASKDATGADDLIFATAGGTPLEWRVIKRRHFKPLLKKLGLPSIRGYDLRHTCTTLMIEAGVSPAAITERLGHVSTAFLLDTYSHVLPHHQIEATKKMGDLLAPTAEEPTSAPKEENEEQADQQP